MGEKNPRVRREEPARSEPLRNFKTLFRQPESEGADEPWDNAVARAVEMGYKVIEEEILQGRNAAKEFADKVESGSVGADATDLIRRVVRFYADMGALWAEMLQSVARNPALSDFLRTASGKSEEPGLTPSTESVTIPVEIISSTATGAQVSLQVQGAQGRRLSVYELRAQDPDKSPLRDVVFEPGSDRWHPILRITIPDGQPPDTYSGVVTDANTNEPCGTLCVRLPSLADRRGQ